MLEKSQFATKILKNVKKNAQNFDFLDRKSEIKFNILGQNGVFRTLQATIVNLMDYSGLKIETFKSSEKDRLDQKI